MLMLLATLHASPIALQLATLLRMTPPLRESFAF